MRWYGRLARAGEIAFVRRRGRVLGAPTLNVYAVPTQGAAGSTVCISVSKAVGDAVVRNLARRRVRGALDALDVRPTGVRMLFVLKSGAATAGYDRIAADVVSVTGQLATAR